MPSVAENTDVVVSDISQLSDDELYQRLVENGVTVGPVVDSTRELYQQKLYNILASTLESDDTPSRRRVSASVLPVNNSPAMERRRSERIVGHSESTDRNILETMDEEIIPSPVFAFIPEHSNPKIPQTPSAPPVISAPRPPSATPPVSTPSSYSYTQNSHGQNGSFNSFMSDDSVARSPYTPSARKPMYDGKTSSYTTSPEFVNRSSSAVNRSTLSHRYDQPDRVATRTPVVEKKKAKKLQTIIFEILLVVFLLIVGYIFYREVEMYSAAEKEFIDSQAPNLNVDQ